MAERRDRALSQADLLAIGAIGIGMAGIAAGIVFAGGASDVVGAVLCSAKSSLSPRGPRRFARSAPQRSGERRASKRKHDLRVVYPDRARSRHEFFFLSCLLASDSASAVRAHDDQVGADVSCSREDPLPRIALLEAAVDLDTPAPALRERAIEGGLARGGMRLARSSSRSTRSSVSALAQSLQPRAARASPGPSRARAAVVVWPMLHPGRSRQER
jgi:hypothetical protein